MFRRSTSLIVITYLILLGMAVPWYWPAQTTALLGGVPVWVVSAVVCSFLASCFTAFLLAKPWPAEREESPHE